MNRIATRVFAVAACLVFAAAAYALAPVQDPGQSNPAPAQQMETKTASGKIIAIQDNSFRLEEASAEGKTHTLEFVLNAQTQVEGDLQVGAKAEVAYRVEQNKNIATSVKVQQAE